MRLVVRGGIGPHAVTVVGLLVSVAEDLPLSNHFSNDKGGPHRKSNSSDVDDVAGGNISGLYSLEQSLVRLCALDLRTRPKSRRPAETDDTLCCGGRVHQPDVVSEQVGLTGLSCRSGRSARLRAGHSGLRGHRTRSKCARGTSLSKLQHVDFKRLAERLDILSFTLKIASPTPKHTLSFSLCSHLTVFRTQTLSKVLL